MKHTNHEEAYDLWYISSIESEVNTFIKTLPKELQERIREVKEAMFERIKDDGQ